MNICFIGPEGSGKGTQAGLLAKELAIPHIISGDILRGHLEDQTQLGDMLREIMNSGQYVPDEKITEIILDRLNGPDCIYGFVLDGYPRSAAQAKALQEYLQSKEQQIDFAFNLLVSHEESMRRLLERKRFDDTPENIKKRLSNYDARAVDLLAYYKHLGVLYMIDGEKSIEEVHEEVKHVVEDFS